MAAQKPGNEWGIFWIFYALAVALGFAILPFASTDTFAASVKALYSTSVTPTTSMVSGFRAAAEDPRGAAALVFLLIGPATPLIAAYATAAWRIGGRAVLELFDRYKPWRRGVSAAEGLRIWAIAMAIGFGMLVFNSLLRIYGGPALGGAEYQWSISAGSVWLFALACILAMFTDGGGVLEETGWRGFAQPLLQRRAGPVFVCIFIGVLWGLWHIPIKFNTISALWEAPGYFFAFYGMYMIGGAASSIIIGYFFNRTGGSTLIAIALHGVQNDSMSISAKLVEGTSPFASRDIGGLLFTNGTQVLPWIIVACVLVIITKGRLGYREGSVLEALDRKSRNND